MKESLMSKLEQLIRSKWKYPLLVLCLGIILLMMPSGKEMDAPSSPEPISESSLEVDPSELERLLSQVQGAGQVRVLLSMTAGEGTEYVQDAEIQSQSDSSGASSRESRKSVLVSTGSGVQMPLERQVTAPTYRGAVIVCQGADNPSVRLALTQAVASLTGLGTNQIVIMKMK